MLYLTWIMNTSVQNHSLYNSYHLSYKCSYQRTETRSLRGRSLKPKSTAAWDAWKKYFLKNYLVFWEKYISTFWREVLESRPQKTKIMKLCPEGKSLHSDEKKQNKKTISWKDGFLIMEVDSPCDRLPDKKHSITAT